jgi:exosortase
MSTLRAATTTAERIENQTAHERLGWLQFALAAALVGILYYRILWNLIGDWQSNPNYAHGFIIPFFCAWVIWKERGHVSEIPIRPSWFGLAIVAGALALLIVGTLGAEIFLSRISLLFLVAGLVIQFRGWQFFRALLFPWTVLFLMIPLPAIIFNEIAFPLQFQASRLASGLLAAIGVPVLREGNVIELPSITLDVVQACGGLRSIVSLITLAVVYGYLLERSLWRRVLLVLISVPIAVFANGLRIMGSGILGQYGDPQKAEGFFHLFSGIFIFLVSLALLITFDILLARFDRHVFARHA